IPYPFKGFYVQHYSPISDQKGNATFRKLVKKDPELAKFDSAAMLAPIAIGFDGQNFLYTVLENDIGTTIVDKIKAVKFSGITGAVNLEKSNTPDKNLYIYRITNNEEGLYVRFP